MKLLLSIDLDREEYPYPLSIDKSIWSIESVESLMKKETGSVHNILFDCDGNVLVRAAIIDNRHQRSISKTANVFNAFATTSETKPLFNYQVADGWEIISILDDLAKGGK